MIDKYENKRTFLCLIISVLTIVCSGYIFTLIKNDILSIILGFSVSILGCCLINFVFNFYNKKIKKYEKDNAEQISLDSSNL